MRCLSIVVATLLVGCGGSGGGGGGGAVTGWTETGAFPIDIGTTNLSILAQGASVYVGTNGGLVATVDDGGSWTTLANGFPTSPSESLPGFTGLTSTGDAILAATYDTVYRSEDGGASWTPSGSGLPDDAYPQVLFATNSVVLAGMSGQSNNPNKQSTVFRSTDDGKSWAIADPAPDIYVTSFAAQGNTLFATCPGGVAQSSDAGQTWTTTDVHILPLSVVVSGSKVLLSGANGQVVSSNDQGKTWTPETNGLPFDGSAYLFANAGDVYASQSAGVYVSHDVGASWSELDSGFGTDKPFIRGFAVHGTYLFGMSDVRGVWRRPLE